MCICFLAVNEIPNYPVVLLFNRDEFYRRPSSPICKWDGADIIAGVDGPSKGTWLAADSEGRFALFHNFYAPKWEDVCLENPDQIICIHSNRTSPEDYKVAVEAGADAVLPKPMSRTHFLKLLLQAAEQARELTLPKSVATAVLPEFALLDDSKLILRAWQRKIGKDAVTHLFTSPNEFRAHVQANEGFLASLDFIVTDFYFAQGVFETGLTFAESLRPVFNKPILLCSDGDFTPEMINGYIDTVIAKNPVEWKMLSRTVAELERK